MVYMVHGSKCMAQSRARAFTPVVLAAAWGLTAGAGGDPAHGSAAEDPQRVLARVASTCAALHSLEYGTHTEVVVEPPDRRLVELRSWRDNRPGPPLRSG